MSIPSSPEVVKASSDLVTDFIGLEELYPLRLAQHAASTQPLLAEIERLKEAFREASRRAVDASELEVELEHVVKERDTARAEAQKLREALTWTMEFVPNPKTEPINPNYREDFERQYGEARKALGGSNV